MADDGAPHGDAAPASSDEAGCHGPTLDRWAVLERAVELARQGEAFALATVVWRQGPSSGQHGSRAIVTASGAIHGWIGGACAEPVLLREALEVIDSGEPRLLWLGHTEEHGPVPTGVTAVPIACQSDGALQIFVEPVQSAPAVLVVGRSPMARTLVELAGALDWNATLVDGDALAATHVPAGAVVIVATQGHGDEDVLEHLMARDPRYVGVVASHRRADALRGYLTDRGIAAERLSRMHAPVGLDLGHTAHREVAVSVLAELVRLRAAGELRTSPGARAAVAASAPATAIDPVCGMTVPATDASRPYEHAGTTYYFCCPACRALFAKDPAAYLAPEGAC